MGPYIPNPHSHPVKKKNPHSMSPMLGFPHTHSLFAFTLTHSIDEEGFREKDGKAYTEFLEHTALLLILFTSLGLFLIKKHHLAFYTCTLLKSHIGQMYNGPHSHYNRNTHHLILLNRLTNNRTTNSTNI